MMPLGLGPPLRDAVAVFVFVSVFYAVAALLCRCHHAAVRVLPGLIRNASSATLGVASSSTPGSLAGFVFRPGWISPSSLPIPSLLQSGFRHHSPQASSWISLLGMIGFAPYPDIPSPGRLSSVSCLPNRATVQICPPSMTRPVWICLALLGLSRVEGPYKVNRADIKVVSSRASNSAEPYLTLSRATLHVVIGSGLDERKGVAAPELVEGLAVHGNNVLHGGERPWIASEGIVNGEKRSYILIQEEFEKWDGGWDVGWTCGVWVEYGRMVDGGKSGWSWDPGSNVASGGGTRGSSAGLPERRNMECCARHSVDQASRRDDTPARFGE